MRRSIWRMQCRRNSESKKKSVPGMSSNVNSNAIGQMFDHIVPAYDILNHLLSFGRDFYWRRRLSDAIDKDKKVRVLDLATGTGDVLISLLKRNSNVTEAVGLDISENMLALCRRKIARHKLTERASLICADAVDSGLKSEIFDIVTIGFGIRNTPDVSATLKEIYRLLKPAGTTLILEFSMPVNKTIRKFYLFYLRYYVPLLGRLISGDCNAYNYLNTSIEKFYSREDFCSLMRETGFVNIEVTELTFCIACIYKGTRPGN
jgi:demethylmenaquinone methyltransferase/2-methoxy-6-polyprenyl-1,4-benzoquinol methylase